MITAYGRKMKVVIVDYGIGNIGSILNMLNRIEVQANFTTRISDIEMANRIILPGVGAFDSGMKQLRKSGLIPALEKRVLEDKVPVLGICLGMQLLFEKSEEGNENGLGWLKGCCVKFKFPNEDKKLKVPHIGWNNVKPMRAGSLFRELTADPRFYFVHSYHVVCSDNDDVLGKTDYSYDFASAVQNKNIYGVQFHPEKSHRYGMLLLKNFMEHA